MKAKALNNISGHCHHLHVPPFKAIYSPSKLERQREKGEEGVAESDLKKKTGLSYQAGAMNSLGKLI